MKAPVTGQSFVQTLRHYLDTNASKFLIDAKGTSKLPAALHHHPKSSLGFFPYMSLLAVTGSAVVSPLLEQTSYMPKDCFSLDIHHLYFLYVHFDYLGLDIDLSNLGEIPPDGIMLDQHLVYDDDDDSDRAPSIRSVSSAMSTLSLSTGWRFWKKQSKEEEDQSVQENLIHIYHCLSKISALKLHMHVVIDPDTGIPKSGSRAIQGYETPLDPHHPPVLSLLPFTLLTCLELIKVHPRWVSDWSKLRARLTRLVIQGAGIEHMEEIVPENTPFHRLQRLSLLNNQLTDLNPAPLNLMKHLTHLNLAHNLLIEVPPALSSLYNLSSLDLSRNMITSTLGIHTILGNIQELNLRGNRLTGLVGLERLWALERLDVAENRLEDRMEISRLVELPNLEDIWVTGNPFTLSNETYRLDLFTEFMPHNSSLKLDGTAPSTSEKARCQSSVSNQYRDEFTPAATTPMDKSNSPPSPPSPTDDLSSSPTTTRSMPDLPQMTRSKSKKTKRVIRLRQDLIEPSMESAASDHVLRYAELQQAIERPVLIRRKSSASKKSTGGHARRKSAPSAHFRSPSPPPPLPETPFLPDDEDFRQKIETMRQEAGTGWLRVLQEMETNKDGMPLL